MKRQRENKNGVRNNKSVEEIAVKEKNPKKIAVEELKLKRKEEKYIQNVKSKFLNNVKFRQQELLERQIVRTCIEILILRLNMIHTKVNYKNQFKEDLRHLSRCDGTEIREYVITGKKDQESSGSQHQRERNTRRFKRPRMAQENNEEHQKNESSKEVYHVEMRKARGKKVKKNKIIKSIAKIFCTHIMDLLVIVKWAMIKSKNH